jgi:transcriptional regulator PpsR
MKKSKGGKTWNLLTKARITVPVTSFKAPSLSLGNLDADATASVIAAASDIAIILTSDGVIHDVAVNGEELGHDLGAGESWLGRPWIETVTVESRPKAEELLSDAVAGRPPRWRHLNQVAPSIASVPILCAAVRLGTADRVVVFGRDLRPISSLQQRLVEAQQSVERDYARLRQAETRYRLLFQISPEPILVVDAPSGRVLEMNPAAAMFFGKTAKRLMGRSFAEAFAPEGQDSVRLLLAAVRAGGRADETVAPLEADGREVTIAVSLLRQDEGMTFLVRLSPARADAPALVLPRPKSKLLEAVEGAPDAFVVTDHEGRILTTNAAFLEAAQLASEEQALGEPLGRWLGRQGVEMEVLVGALRQRGSVRLFATTLRGEHGGTTEVEVSAVSVTEAGGRDCFGFAIRDVGMRLATASGRGEPLRSVGQITELIGRVPLKDLVREATDVIERLCIEAALQLTGDNRASAAELLGLSRQSLYVKLRRYGLGDLGSEANEIVDS